MGQHETTRLRDRAFSPEQLSAFVLQKIKRDAEAFLGESVQQAQRITSRRDSGVMLQQITPCPTCHGRGSIIDQPCAECQGRGETEHPEDIQVTIPAGVEEGMALRIPGHGLPSREANGPPGDLFVVVHSTPDARFERQGTDLWHLETV